LWYDWGYPYKDAEKVFLHYYKNKMNLLYLFMIAEIDLYNIFFGDL